MRLFGGRKESGIAIHAPQQFGVPPPGGARPRMKSNTGRRAARRRNSSPGTAVRCCRSARSSSAPGLSSNARIRRRYHVRRRGYTPVARNGRNARRRQRLRIATSARRSGAGTASSGTPVTAAIARMRILPAWLPSRHGPRRASRYMRLRRAALARRIPVVRRCRAWAAPIDHYLRRVPAHILNGLTVPWAWPASTCWSAPSPGPSPHNWPLSGAIGTSLADVPNDRAAQRAPRVPRRRPRRTGLHAGSSAAASTRSRWAWPLRWPAGLAMLLTAWGAAGQRGGRSRPCWSWSFRWPRRPTPRCRCGRRCGMRSVLGLLSRVVRADQPAAGDAAIGRWRSRRRSLPARSSSVRARRIVESPAAGPGSDGGALRGWVAAEAALAESLQGARDFVYAAPADAEYPRNVTLLQHLLECATSC